MLSHMSNGVPLGSSYLHGLTNYGDSVEDEWLIVYLLREISRRFPELWIRVTDSDGEFLLIEAANALPRWLNPEIADNRVWIHNNTLRIIPLAAAGPTTSGKTAPISRSLSVTEAQKILEDAPQSLIHSPLVEAEAFYRLRNYPAQINASLHHSLVRIPRKLAQIIHSCPSSISYAVDAFYLRDPVAMKPLQTVSAKLVFPPEDLVTLSVKFTKVLYAQVKSQQFSPPLAWKPIFSELEKIAASDPLKQKELLQMEVGMKVTSGYEMIVSDLAKKDDRIYRELLIIVDDLNEDLEAGNTDVLPSNDKIASWPKAGKEDDESWLDINFEDFEKELQGKSGQNKNKGPLGAFGPDEASGFGDAKTQADLKKMVERFEAFMNDEDAGIDGAEMDDMDLDDDDDDDDEYDSEDEDKEVSFDENEFARMMKEMMGMPVEEEDHATGPTSAARGASTDKVEEIDTDEEEDGDEAEEIHKVMKRMEAELNEAGALDLDPKPNKPATLGSSSTKGKSPEEPINKQEESDSDGEINIDFNLAKNLLESFKSQAGMAGPGGNLMGMMGMQLPRDEDDTYAKPRK